MWFLIVDVRLNHCAGILFREHKGFTLDVGPVFLTFFTLVFFTPVFLTFLHMLYTLAAI